MNDKSSKFIEQLTHAENISPALRASYRAELETMLQPTLKRGQKLMGILLLIALVTGVGGVVRNLFVFSARPIAGWLVLAATFLMAACVVGRDLWRGKSSPKSEYSIPYILRFAAAAITVMSLLAGVGAPDKAAATFNAFYVFIFYFACSEWAVHSRIAAAELAAREQMLRIECRLADLSERFAKG
jgi:putative Ca2+/H+ antiporter (TMEM165/GDT1 family)